WFEDLYDIDANADRPVAVADLRLMLQSLLKERLKMSVHRDNQDVSSVQLVVASNGPKVAPVRNPDCTYTMTDGPCGEFDGGPSRGLRGRNVSMSALAATLTTWIGQTVSDNTSLAGLFDIKTTPWLRQKFGPNFAPEVVP